MFGLGEKTPVPKFQRGDMAFTDKDHEKVRILKPLPFDPEDKNADLGIMYLLRGNENKLFRLYECELKTLDEITGVQLQNYPKDA